MSCFMVDNVIENETLISTPEKVESILELLAPLVSDQEDGPKAENWDDPEEFAEEQGLMGRLVHLLTSEEDPDIHYQILSVSRKYFGTGGPKRVSYTLPPIIFQAFQLAKKFYLIKDKVRSRSFSLS